MKTVSFEQREFSLKPSFPLILMMECQNNFIPYIAIAAAAVFLYFTERNTNLIYFVVVVALLVEVLIVVYWYIRPGNYSFTVNPTGISGLWKRTSANLAYSLYSLLPVVFDWDEIEKVETGRIGTIRTIEVSCSFDLEKSSQGSERGNSFLLPDFVYKNPEFQKAVKEHAPAGNPLKQFILTNIK